MNFLVRIVTLFLVGLLAACVQTGESQSVPSQSNVQTVHSSGSTAISELYSNWEKDADIAIAVKDFRLLTFSDTKNQAPGVLDFFALQDLQEHCGLRVLPGRSEFEQEDFQATQNRSMLRYAEQYNKLVFEACEKFKGKIRNKR